MKKSILIKLHVYCGLFTAFYLLAFGLSTIILNHQIDVENQTTRKNWGDMITVDPDLGDRALAESTRDQLGMMGWVPPWRYRKDSTVFQFEIVHLAKTSTLQLDLRTGKVAVAEAPKGVLATFHGLHFFNGRIPNAPFFLKTWIVYQWLALLVLFFSLILGLWLWLKYSYKTWELYVFGGLFILSITIMLLL